jgi:hypothetical protein
VCVCVCVRVLLSCFKGERAKKIRVRELTDAWSAQELPCDAVAQVTGLAPGACRSRAFQGGICASASAGVCIEGLCYSYSSAPKET